MEEDNTTHLIIRYLSHEATVEEEEALIDWISRDTSHQKIFSEWVEIWNLRPPVDSSFNLTNALGRLNNRIDVSEAKSGLTLRNIAAAVLIVLTTGSLFFFSSRYSKLPVEDVSYVEKKTGTGAKLELNLSDGSTIVLNGNSTIRYPNRFTEGSREVFLTGEAFFEVVKDTEHPFIIHTNNINTRVLGTSFNVNARSKNTIVSVVTGKVQVNHGSLSEIAIPNEKITYNSSEGSLEKARANLESDLAWRTNTIIFDDSDLSEASERIQEVYGYSIVFEKDNLRACLITGKFKDQPLHIVLKAISFSTNTQYRIQGKTVTIFGHGCEK
jgi:transmembrane sensor